MPLPEADPPEQSRLYEELKSKTALPSATGAITPDLLDNLKNATFVDADNEDQLRRLVLLMQATGVGSMSGPIPGTQEVVNFVKTDSSFSSIKDPGVGEVYQYVAGSIVSVSGGSGNITTEVSILNPDGNRVLIIDQSSSGSSDYPLVETNFAPIFVSYPNKLQFKHEGTFTSVTSNFSTIRVR